MYRDHKDIPPKFRRIILDETLSKRVSKVPLSVCNEIIAEHLEDLETLESLLNYEVIVSKNGVRRQYNFRDPEAAFVALDREIGYDEHDPTVLAVLKQADRIIRAFVNGKWISPPPKDAVVIKNGILS